MINFFSDLDNTLVYSHRVSLPGEHVVVEHLNNRIQSYMTKKTYDFLTESDGILLIPTTTRTCEQYARLSETFAKFGCRYALVCNGGILLDNNEVDLEWIAETKAIAGDELSSLYEAEKMLLRIFPNQCIHSVSDIMVYAKTDNPASDAGRLSTALNTAGLNIYYDSRKVYCIPSSINKGNAIKRFSDRMRITWSVAAGDSAPDIPMLEATDAAILPYELSNVVENRQKYVADNSQCFSDYICDVLSGLLLLIQQPELCKESEG